MVIHSRVWRPIRLLVASFCLVTGGCSQRFHDSVDSVVEAQRPPPVSTLHVSPARASKVTIVNGLLELRLPVGWRVAGGYVDGKKLLGMAALGRTSPAALILKFPTKGGGEAMLGYYMLSQYHEFGLMDGRHLIEYTVLGNHAARTPCARVFLGRYHTDLGLVEAALRVTGLRLGRMHGERKHETMALLRLARTYFYPSRRVILAHPPRVTAIINNWPAGNIRGGHRVHNGIGTIYAVGSVQFLLFDKAGTYCGRGGFSYAGTDLQGAVRAFLKLLSVSKFIAVPDVSPLKQWPGRRRAKLDLYEMRLGEFNWLQAHPHDWQN